MIPLKDNIPSKSFPFINWAFIAANIYIFYVMLRLPNPNALQAFVNHWAVIPLKLWKNFPPAAPTLITATFIHGGWLHIIFNMLFLFIFGDNVEDRMGHIRYAIFYVLVGVIANLSQAYLSQASTIPMLGASGAIAGVLGAYFFYFPHARVLALIPLGFFITIREVPAFLFLGLWFLLQTLSGAMSISAQVTTHQNIGGVAWWAHAGGFVAGLLLGPIMAPKQGRFR